METQKKLEILGAGAKYDLSCACGQTAHRERGPLERWIYPAVLPDGERVFLLKVLLSNQCEKDCGYCANRSGRDQPGASFGPEELARSFIDLHAKGIVGGLFLSSAVCGGAVQTMDRMIAAAELVRRAHRFRGYLHLKILPGAQEAQVERAGALATRVSINLEVPRGRYLEKIAPGKKPEDILGPLSWIRRLSDERPRGWAPSGFTTQFMVGAAGETDREIAESAFHLYRRMGARRVYFSAFQPVEGTPLESAPPCPLVREHRLYQCDFLFRKYGFSFDEIPFDGAGGLSAEVDPKTAWAALHPDLFPVETGRAPLELLLRVPGIGPKTARRIVVLRRAGSLSAVASLLSAGAIGRRVSPFVLVGGRRLSGQGELLPEKKAEDRSQKTGDGIGNREATS